MTSRVQFLLLVLRSWEPLGKTLLPYDELQWLIRRNGNRMREVGEKVQSNEKEQKCAEIGEAAGAGE